MLKIFLISALLIDNSKDHSIPNTYSGAIQTIFLKKDFENHLDTITNWQFYLNDSLLIADNVFGYEATNELIKINLEDLNSDDNIIIRYHTCAWYERMKKVVLKDENNEVILKLEFNDENSYSPFIMDYGMLDSLKGKGILTVYYNEYVTADHLSSRSKGRTGYIYPHQILGKIKVK